MERLESMPFLRNVRSGGISCVRPNKIVILCLLAGLGCLLFFKASALPSIPSEYKGYSLQSPIAKQDEEPLIPNQVWQCYTTVGERDASVKHLDALKKTKIQGDLTATWLPVDGAWTYSFVGKESGEALVRKQFSDQQDIIDVYTGLKLPVMVSDFLRYLLLAGYGGAYADSDVQMTKRLDKWVPEKYRGVTRAMVGIEKDTAGKDGVWKTTFAQYVLYAGKGHPIMKNMVRNITDTILGMAADANSSIADLKIKDQDVLQISGPRGFSSIIYDHLSEQTGRNVNYLDVTNITEPKLFGDTLILPINFFGSGQGHSGSRGDSPDQLVRHYFKGSWRHW